MFIAMCAKFGKDQTISFQVIGKKAKALPTDRRMDKVTYRVAVARD